MKKRISTLALAMLSLVGAGAQTIYDATTIAQRDLNGTARFVGMGGAMGALGGDISTISTNPAGLGIYRSNDAMLTLGYSLTGTESNYQGAVTEMDKARWNLENAGVVIATKFSNQAALRYINFGFNYHKSRSFYKNMSMQGMMGSIDGIYASQVRQMAQQAEDVSNYLYNRYDEKVNFNRNDVYQDDLVGWLGALGVQGNLVGQEYYSGDYDGYYPIVPAEVDGLFNSRERGGVDQYDFNVSFNVSDRFYFGMTVGVSDVDYKKYSLWDEDYGNGEWYTLESFNRIHGTGFNAKFGAIIRPIEDSPLRIGLAIHTPTWYDLTYTTGAFLDADVYMEKEVNGNTVSELEAFTIDTRDYLNGGDMERDFTLQTPWVFNASLGYTVGTNLALGAEYEYENYSSMKFSDRDGYEDAFGYENNEVDLCLKGVSTLRLGAEFKPIASFALRAGYNYSTAAYKEDAIKSLPFNSINTDTDFSNHKASNTFTLGIGYRGPLLYADLAYKYNMYKSDFYPFYNEIDGAVVTPPATEVTNTRSQVLFTLGIRF